MKIKFICKECKDEKISDISDMKEEARADLIFNTCYEDCFKCHAWNSIQWKYLDD